MYEYRATLRNIVDGDTYDLEIDLGLRVRTNARVRLRGVNTPETYGVKRSSDEWERGQAAKRFVEEWFATHGPELRVRTYKDATEKFGRWLADIEDPSDGAVLSDALVASGHGTRMDY